MKKSSKKPLLASIFGYFILCNKPVSSNQKILLTKVVPYVCFRYTPKKSPEKAF